MLALDKHAFPQTYIVDSKYYIIHIHTSKKAYWVTYFYPQIQERCRLSGIDGLDYWSGILEWLKWL